MFVLILVSLSCSCLYWLNALWKLYVARECHWEIILTNHVHTHTHTLITKPTNNSTTVEILYFFGVLISKSHCGRSTFVCTFTVPRKLRSVLFGFVTDWSYFVSTVCVVLIKIIKKIAKSVIIKQQLGNSNYHTPKLTAKKINNQRKIKKI